MLTLVLKLFVLCFVTVKGNEFIFPQLPPELQAINRPEDLANHFMEKLTGNETRALISKECVDHVREYVLSLLRFEPWALKMFDANAKFPSGLFRGNLGNLGSFDECLKTKSKSKFLGVLRGKYCLGEIHLLNLDNFKGRAQTKELPGQERWVNFAEGLVTIPWGICLPEVCSAQDFRFLHFLFFLRFREETCQTLESQTKEFDNEDIGAIWFFGVIGALMVLSTSYDIAVYYTRKGRGSALLRSFSIITNGRKIVTVKNDLNDIGCLHGLRMLPLLLVTLGLRYAGYLLSPNQNWIDVAKFWWDALEYLEMLVILDTTLVVSGMLVSYNYLKARSEGGQTNIIALYFIRILRLTPGLIAIVLLHTTLLRHMGSGPIWTKMRDQYLVNNCRDYWWSSLLYIQNYVNPSITRICVLQTWQLSVDMQLFILSPLILIPLAKKPKYTLFAVGFLLICSMVSPFLAGWVYKLKAVIKTSRSLEDIRKFARHFYFPTHTRASTWIIGFIVGYLVFESRRRTFKIRKEILAITVLLLWSVSFGLIALCFLVGKPLIGKEYDWVKHSLHLAFIRPAWAIAVGWIIFACANGYGGVINAFLSLRCFQVLSRISYGTYLVFITVMFVLTYQTRSNLEFQHLQAFYRFFSDVLICFAVGLLWTLAFESPFIMIVKTFFGKRKGVDKTKGGMHSQRL